MSFERYCMTSRPISLIKPLDLTKARWLAPLSKRYARIASLHALPPSVALIAGNCVAFDEGRVIFVKNHKAACSTIAQLIYLHQNGSVCEGNIHKDYKGLIQGLPNFPAVAAALIARDTFKFTFVRHPVSRAVSAFKNIFLRRAMRPGHCMPKASGTGVFLIARAPQRILTSFSTMLLSHCTKTPSLPIHIFVVRWTIPGSTHSNLIL